MPLTNRFRLLVLLATTCANFAFAFGRPDTVPTSVSGVNYTDQDIRYMLFDPKDEKRKVVAAEDIGPFAAGGVMCCYNLPKTWKSGIQVGVLLDVFDEKLDNYLPRQTFIVDLPPYDKGGKAGDVWFIRYPDNTVGVVSTAYRPNGDEWPGKIKGWPKPSVEYQRKLWERDMKLAQADLKASSELKEEFDRDPSAYLKKQWAFYLKIKEDRRRPPEELKMFTGPDDPAFLIHERKWKDESLRYSQDKVNRLLKVKP